MALRLLQFAAQSHHHLLLLLRVFAARHQRGRGLQLLQLFIARGAGGGALEFGFSRGSTGFAVAVAPELLQLRRRNFFVLSNRGFLPHQPVLLLLVAQLLALLLLSLP